jgi:hypothetical protein
MISQFSHKLLSNKRDDDALQHTSMTRFAEEHHAGAQVGAENLEQIGEEISGGIGEESAGRLARGLERDSWTNQRKI